VDKQQIRQLLGTLTFGDRVAESESDHLSSYFVETHQWDKIFDGSVDIVYGPKGSGKSALYLLLLSRELDFIDKNIILVPAEEPRGDPVFKELVSHHPTTEFEFVSLWKLYLLSIAVHKATEWGINNGALDPVVRTLQQSGLLKDTRNLRTFLRASIDYVRRLLSPESIEGGVLTDPTTGAPVGLTGKITLRDPTSSERRLGFTSIRELLMTLDKSLKESNYHIWLVIDRLDSAFLDSHALETNALRGLFRSYLDLSEFDNIHLKIFLRSDIWQRITEGGFREASHITREIYLTWDRSSLLNVLIKRILVNDKIRYEYKLNPARVLANINRQEQLLERLFPEHMDDGLDQPKTFDWMIEQTSDGTKANTPRELIHLLTAAQDLQISNMNIGKSALKPNGEKLFEREAIKNAMKEVSRARLEKTLYSEYPEHKTYVEKMERQNAQQRVDKLARLWEMEISEAKKKADALVEVGFFEKRGTTKQPLYWVPFLYREALEIK
jgi:hypothetical protein